MHLGAPGRSVLYSTNNDHGCSVCCLFSLAITDFRLNVGMWFAQLDLCLYLNFNVGFAEKVGNLPTRCRGARFGATGFGALRRPRHSGRQLCVWEQGGAPSGGNGFNAPRRGWHSRRQLCVGGAGGALGCGRYRLYIFTSFERSHLLSFHVIYHANQKETNEKWQDQGHEERGEGSPAFLCRPCASLRQGVRDAPIPCMCTVSHSVAT